jgi:hypothetical protein
MLGHAATADAILLTEVAYLSLIPGTRNMIGANLELVGAERREFRLRDALEPIRAEYPFILLDCPPALDLLTLNALVAADTLLVPMQAEYFALEGVSGADGGGCAADDVRRPDEPFAAGARQPERLLWRQAAEDDDPAKCEAGRGTEPWEAGAAV